MVFFDKLKKKLMLESNPQKSKDQSSLIPSEEIPVYVEQSGIAGNSKLNRIALLTQREYELFLLLIEGFALKESAKQLSIKYSTANTHMTGIYKKLGVNSRAELIINYRYFGTGKKSDL